jgi:hypothetical protein
MVFIEWLSIIPTEGVGFFPFIAALYGQGNCGFPLKSH